VRTQLGTHPSRAAVDPTWRTRETIPLCILGICEPSKLIPRQTLRAEDHQGHIRRPPSGRCGQRESALEGASEQMGTVAWKPGQVVVR